MRVLHYLCYKMPHLCIWPFDRLPESRPAAIAVEVYSGAFVHKSKVARGKVRDVKTLDRILKFYDSEPLRNGVLEGGALGDKADALIVAAALRRLSGKGEFWNPPGLRVARQSHEGWIFGVT